MVRVRKWCGKKGVFCVRIHAISSTLLQLLSSHYSRPILFLALLPVQGVRICSKPQNPQACAKGPMATRNLAWAIGKRKISVSSLHFTPRIHSRSLFTGYTPTTPHLRPPLIPPLPPLLQLWVPFTTLLYITPFYDPPQHIFIKSMNQNPSLIDVLQNLAQQQQPQSSQHGDSYTQMLSKLPHCESMELSVLPVRIRPHIKSFGGGEQRSIAKQQLTRTERLSSNKEGRVVVGPNSKTLSSTNSQNLNSRNDEIMFQIKLKLASFVTKFNIDSKCLSNVRDQCVESMLEMVFKKFKDYTKEHESVVKNHNETLKCKQIEILNLQTKFSNLEEFVCQETNRWSKANEKLKEQNSQLQKSLQQKGEEAEQMHQNIYMLETIVKEQNQYIREIQEGRNSELQQKVEHQQQEIASLSTKCNTLREQAQMMRRNIVELDEENQKLNEQINQMMSQNREYKNESNSLKEMCEKLKNELDQNQQKLLAYYDKFTQESENCNYLRQTLKETQVKNEQLNKELSRVGEMLQKVLLEKQEMLAHNEKIRRQSEGWRKECQSKQAEIIKLNKALSQVVNSYKSRPLQKKSRSEVESPSETYVININPEVKIRQELEAQQEQKIKGIINEWRNQMEKTVEYYEKYIEELGSRKPQLY